MNHEVFISYSSKDKAVADAVCHVLEQHNMQCWIAPRDVQPGARYAAEIVNGIKNCKVMVLVYSKESNQSDHVANEVDRAFNGGKAIIPFLVDDTPMNDEFDYYLSRMHWLVAYPHYADQLEHLAHAVANVLGIEFKSLSEIGQGSHNSNNHTLHQDNPPSILQNLANNMVYVEGGSFHMGNNISRDCDAFEDEMPIHEVNTSSFYICKYEVTQDEWLFVMGNNPSLFGGSKRPVDNISWDDCQLFIKKLNELTGKQFRLPTEAEWEYAARGGKRSHGFKYAGSNRIQDVAWFEGNSDGQTHEVGSKMPNELGLYDMSGNVFEWCQDWYGNYSVEIRNNPSGPSSGDFLVNRGGSWNNLASNCRVTDRLYDTSTYHDSCSGFRLAHNK